MCPRRGYNYDVTHHCACTQVIDISDLPEGSVVEIVLTNKNIDLFISFGATVCFIFTVITFTYVVWHGLYGTIQLMACFKSLVMILNTLQIQTIILVVLVWHNLWGRYSNFIQELKWGNILNGLCNPEKWHGFYIVTTSITSWMGWMLLWKSYKIADQVFTYSVLCY